MFKVGDVVVCIDANPKPDYVFWDYVSYIKNYYKKTTLEINCKYTIAAIYTYWGDDGNGYDVISDTSIRCDNTSYKLVETNKQFSYCVFDMNRFINLKDYRKLKILNLNKY